MEKKRKIREIADLLESAYPEAVCELDFRSPFQLLVATILSAQCTDVRVNQVTPALFQRFPGVEELASAPTEEIEDLIRSTGFFRNKARSIQGAARMIRDEFGGELPHRLEDMVRLPGVGKKTAKVVLGEAFGIPAGNAVDTHVRRLASRLGLSKASDPDRISAELESLLPKERWLGFSLRMVLHGRRVCRARSPECRGCTLLHLCPSSKDIGDRANSQHQ